MSSRLTRSGRPAPNSYAELNIVSSDEENFNSADHSFHDQIDFDGALPTPATEDSTLQNGAAVDLHLVANRLRNMVNYDATNAADSEGALEKACNNLRGKVFNQLDLGFYFNQVELKMQQSGVKKNYTKLLVLTSILPENVQEEVKWILRMQETDFGTDMPYLKLKNEIIKIFKPSQEADFERAMGRILSERPSQLARQLVNDLCDHKLVGCCCKKFIVGQWKRQLPSSVKMAIAGMEFSAENFDAICEKADASYASTRPAGVPSSQVSALALSGAVSLPGPASLDQAFHPSLPDQAEVAAITRGRGRGGGQWRGQSRGGYRGGQNRGRGRGGQSRGNGQQGQSQAHPRHKGQRHPDGPPIQSCFRHWVFGKSAHFCEEPGSCPWKDFWVPKSNQ